MSAVSTAIDSCATWGLPHGLSQTTHGLLLGIHAIHGLVVDPFGESPRGRPGPLVSRGAGFWPVPTRRRRTARMESWRGGQPRRYSKTASTRFESLPVVGRSSLLKMLDTYFSTARNVITNRSAMP